jgi:Fic-DOC domain mobile mystery protein B
MGLRFENGVGQTPINEEELDGLKIRTITLQVELNEFEQYNIEKALLWLRGQRLTMDHVLSELFVLRIHAKMFGEVWQWAGNFRKTEKNLGVNSVMIRIALKELINDAKYWMINEIYTPEELAIRFKHRLVSIHCFSNGNGRHSRVMADVIMEKLYNKPPFQWGKADAIGVNTIRMEYLKSLRQADQHEYQPLIAFALGREA